MKKYVVLYILGWLNLGVYMLLIIVAGYPRFTVLNYWIVAMVCFVGGYIMKEIQSYKK